LFSQWWLELLHYEQHPCQLESFVKNQLVAVGHAQFRAGTVKNADSRGVFT
jgi:hypothetical protein